MNKMLNYTENFWEKHEMGGYIVLLNEAKKVVVVIIGCLFSCGCHEHFSYPSTSVFKWIHGCCAITVKYAQDICLHSIFQREF